ncbi:hypothetical protein B4099_2461 [Heyndrickxia coagulans]|uniref:Uncharacterized protein n=1 Tax=Heyndrickxia coagulans TaxID=1398 RepID=A0A150KB62_HEYCO|nr:hypothetical protein B4099_2461 [Heyndrickxia coagulans]
MSKWINNVCFNRALVVEKIAYGQAIIAGIGGFSYDIGYPGSGE